MVSVCICGYIDEMAPKIISSCCYRERPWHVKGQDDLLKIHRFALVDHKQNAFICRKSMLTNLSLIKHREKCWTRWELNWLVSKEAGTGARSLLQISTIIDNLVWSIDQKSKSSTIEHSLFPFLSVNFCLSLSLSFSRLVILPLKQFMRQIWNRQQWKSERESELLAISAL